MILGYSDGSKSVLEDKTPDLVQTLLTDDEFKEQIKRNIKGLRGSLINRGLFGEYLLDLVLQHKFAGTTTREDFINRIGRPQLESLLNKSLRSPISLVRKKFTVTINGQAKETLLADEPVIFVGNHSNIIFDPLLTGKAVFDIYGASKVPFFVIGDNLLDRPWVKNLVELGGAYSFPRNRRDKAFRTKYNDFISNSDMLLQNGHSIWIAQTPGRAKDGIYKTNPGVLNTIQKMSENYGDINIIPFGIAYKYDPTDYIKVVETLIRRKIGSYVKGENEDFISMREGLRGKLGRVEANFGEPVLLRLNYGKSELIELSREIDRSLFEDFSIFGINKYAASGGQYYDKTGKYRRYLDGQVEKALDFVSAKPGVKLTRDEIKLGLLEFYGHPLRTKKELFSELII